MPQTDRFVYAELGLAQPSLTTLALTGDLYIYRYDVRSRVYDADDLGQAYSVANKYQGEPSGAAFVGEIEKAVRDGLTRILNGSFAGATISGVTATVERSTLGPASGNPFDPPVRVSVTASVARTRAAVGLGELTDAAVEAAFASGARTVGDFTLKADPGYRIVYAIRAPASPAGLKFEAGAGVSADGGTVTVDVDNTAGAQPSANLAVRVYDPRVTPPTAEDIRSTIDVTMGAIEKGAAGIPVTIDVDAEVSALDLASRMSGVLPSKVSLPYLSADGLRALRAAGAIKDADLAKANDALLATVRADVARAFGQGATATGGLVQADLAAPAAKPYDGTPPVHFRARAQATKLTEGVDADDVDLALRIGGIASVDLQLFAANGRATTFTIHPPGIAEFSAAKAGSVSADRQTATFAVPAGAAAFPAQLSLRGRDVPSFTQEDASIDVKVDLQDLDVSLGKALGGDFGNLLVELTVTADLGVIELPDELRGSLPPNLELAYISSDAIRLLVDRGYVTDADLAKLESSLMKQVAEKLGGALGGTIPVEGGIDRATLAASLVATPVSGDKPIQFKASARVLKPLAGGDVQPQAAIALYTQELPLTLPKLEGLDTLYTVILPRGLAVTGLEGTGAQTQTGKAPDGRQQFTVRPTSENAQVTVAMSVTPTFVLAKFWPIVLLAVILLVLIIGTPIALVVRSRGRKKRALAKK